MTSKKNAKTMARAKKAPAPRQPSPKATSPTLANVAAGFLADLEKRGKTASTIASYRNDLGIALHHFGAETKVTIITEKQSRPSTPAPQ